MSTQRPDLNDLLDRFRAIMHGIDPERRVWGIVDGPIADDGTRLFNVLTFAAADERFPQGDSLLALELWKEDGPIAESEAEFCCIFRPEGLKALAFLFNAVADQMVRDGTLIEEGEVH